MIDVSVGKHNRIDLFGVEGKFPVLLERELSLTLVQPAVKQDFFPIVMDQVH